MEFTHIAKSGRVKMVDVSWKKPVKRTAIAKGKILLKPETIDLIKKRMIKKGDVLACARIAGITGGKKTGELIPLCHNIFIDQIDVDFEITSRGIAIEAKAVCVDRTGAEMEAITAVCIAAITIYDMCKAVDKNMVITDIRLLKKIKEPLNENI